MRDVGTYSDGTPVKLLPENDEDSPSFALSADDIRRQARAQAIADCITVVREYLEGQREGDLDIAELVPRLEALKDTKP